MVLRLGSVLFFRYMLKKMRGMIDLKQPMEADQVYSWTRGRAPITGVGW